MGRAKTIFLAAVLVALCGCYRVKPPSRPVAYLYPTVMPMSALESCTARPATPQEVRAILEEATLLPLLEKAGLLPGDLEIMARGLAKRGYAELDARRAPGNLNWVAILFREKGCHVLGGFAKKPAAGAGFDAAILDGQAKSRFERDPYGRVKSITEYPSEQPNALLRLVRLDGKAHWESWFFLDGH